MKSKNLMTRASNINFYYRTYSIKNEQNFNIIKISDDFDVKNERKII